MDTNDSTCHTPATAYELFFDSLFNSGRGFAFPCDCGGHVDLGQLSERARANYFFSRIAVGRELAVPVVQLADPRQCKANAQDAQFCKHNMNFLLLG